MSLSRASSYTGADKNKSGLSRESFLLYNPLVKSQPEDPLISVVIPNYEGLACLELCLQSLMRQTCPRMEILLVDNASRDRSIERAQQIAPGIRILAQKSNLGFAAAVNLGVKEAHGAWIAVLNNDTEAAEDWLQECAAAIARHPDASFQACRILDYRSPNRIYSAGDCFLRAGIGYRRGQELPDSDEYGVETRIFSACGCAALYRKTVFAEAGGYDELFFAYLEDVDLGLRLQAAGARGYYVPAAKVFHRGGATSGGEFSPLAVRLRTRNSILLLLKSVPARVFWRCLPMILAGQVSWFARTLAHGRLFSYLRGLAGVIPLAPAMIARRRRLRPAWMKSSQQFWNAILESENMARRDYQKPGAGASRFMTWYFRLF